MGIDEKEDRVGAATLCGRADNATSPVHHQIHKHSLVHNNGRDLIAICMSVILKKMKYHAYPYTFQTEEGSVRVCIRVLSWRICVGQSSNKTHCAQKAQKAGLPPTALQQDDEFDAIESNDDILRVAIGVRGFNQTA